MSHLPLDARAILDYLNELGYRNISAEQLKEFMKGMQSQSESYKIKFKAKVSSSSNNSQQQQIQRRELQRQHQQQQRQQQPLQSSTSATRTVTKSTATAANTEAGTAAAAAVVGSKSTNLLLSNCQRRPTVKVIKCKKPLCHFKFYLDICDHQLAKRIEEQIRTLGGALEFFLTANVTHFITDKAILPTIVGSGVNNNNNNNSSNNNNNSLSSSRPGTPQTPGTPKTPQTPYDTPTTTSQDGKCNVLASVGCNTPTTGTISRKSTTINTRQTRANAILNRVRRASNTTTPNNVNAAAATINVNAVNVNLVERAPNSPTTIPISLKEVKSNRGAAAGVTATTPPIIVSTQNPYIVWQTEYALHFFKKVQHELKDYLGGNNNNNNINTHLRHENAHAHKLLHHVHKGGRTSSSSSTIDAIDLKGGGFLKIESIKRNYRPYYQLFRKSSGTEWPKIELTREDGAFRLSPKKKQQQQQKANVEEVITAAAVGVQHKQQQQRAAEEALVVKGNDLNDDDDDDDNNADKVVKMTRKSRSRSSQSNQRTQPAHAAVKTLKKSGAADTAAKVKSTQRNSHAAGVGAGGAGAGAGAAAAAAAACKQVKESSDKQCGVCEICKIEYDTLTIHLKTKDHEYFAKNSQNFIALDSLIHTSADVSKFLSEDKKVTDLEEMEVENIEVMADENEPDPLEGSEPLMGVGGGGGGAAGRGGGAAGEVVTPLPLLELTDDKRRLAGGAHHTPSPTLREKSKRSTKGKHSSEKFQNIRLSKSPKSTNRAATTSPLKQQLAPATCTTTTTTTTTTDPAAAPISSSTLELQHIAATSATAAHAVKTVKTAKSAPARRKTISASALSPPIRAMLPPSSLYKVVGTPETSVYGTPTRKMRAGGGDIQTGGGVHEAAVTASPSLIVKFKKVRTTELNRLNGEAESFMFPKQRTSSELPTDVDRQTTSENAHARSSSSSSSLDTSTSDGECSMDVEEEEEREGASARVGSSKTSGGSKQQTGKRAIATAKRRKDSKAIDGAATKQRFPSTPIQPDIQLKHTKEEVARKSTNATVLSKTQQTATKPPTKTTATKATTKMSKSLSSVSSDNSPAAAAKRPTAALSAAAAKANAAAAVLAAITLPEATRKSSRTATAIVTAATTSSRLLRAAVEAAKYNCRQMAAGNEQQPLVGGGNERKMSTTKTSSANEVVAPAKMTTPKKSQSQTAAPTKSTAVQSTIVTKSTHKRVPVVKLEDRMGDLKNEQKKKIVIKKRSRSSDSDEDDDDVDDREKDEDGRAPVSKCIKNEKPNVTVKKEVLKAYSGLRGVINDDDDDDDYDDEEVDNDDDKDEDYIHCIKSRRKSVAYDNLSALWQSGSLNTSSGALSRKQRAAQREEQKYKLAMLAAVADDGVEDATLKSAASDTVKVGGIKSKNSKEAPSKTPIKLNITATATTSSNKQSNKIAATNVDCAPEEVSSKRITTTPTPPPIKPKINERIKFDLANSTRLNQMRYSFERLPVTDLWYRVFMRQDTCTERFFEYYGSTNYRKLPYELGPIPYAHTLNNGICCKLCEKQQGNTSSTSEFLLSSSKQAKSRRGFLSKTPAAAAVTACKVKKEPMEELDSEAGASKSRDSSSGKSHDILAANTNNLCTAETVATTALTTATTNTNSASNTTTTQYQHKHKKLAFLHRYRQEQQELQKRQAAAAAAADSEQQLSSAQQQLGDNSNQCDSNASTTAGQERTPRDRKRAGSTHSTTSNTSCASSTATTKTSKNRYFNKHLNKAAASFLNLELPPRKSPREHASTLALVSCIIKQRQDSQSKPNSDTDEPSPSAPTAMSTVAGAAEPATTMNANTEPSDSVAKSSNSELQPTVLRSPRHTRSAAATPVEEMRFTTVISENVKRMRRGQNKYDHSPPVAAHTQSQSSISRKTGRGRPPRTYGGLQKFLQTTGSALTNRRSQTPSSVLTASTTALADATVTTTGDRRRRTKHDTGWTTTTPGLVTGAGRQHHSHYTGLLAQGSAVPSIRKTGSKKGVLEFEVDATALKALDVATKNTNVRHLEWQIDKFLQLYGREYDVDIDDDLALRIGVHQETVKEAPSSPPPPESSNTTTNSTTKKCSSISAVTSSASASTSKALRRVNAANVDAKCSTASSSTSLTETAAAAPFDSATNTPPPTDYFSSDFDLYDLFTNAARNAASEDEQTAYISGKRKGKNFSLYSSLAMQNYFRKRKSLKSNRTGWPKVQKKKTSVRQQHMLARKIRFLQDIGELPSKNANGNGFKQEPNGEGSKEDEEVMDDADEDDEAAATSCGGDKQPRRRGNGVITPPASEMEVKQNNIDDCADEDTELEEDEEDGGDDDDDDEEEEIDDDGETMAETIDEDDEDDAEAVTQTARDVDAAAEADEEDLEDAELDMDAAATKRIGGDGDNVDNDDEDTLMDDDSRLHVPATRKRNRRHRRHGGSRDESTQEEIEKRLLTNSPLRNAAAHTSSNNTNNNNGVTSTPTKQLLRAGSALRRTPQLLNGSLGSCISPSEKAGDNSDIFTVSSDGLDTDLDMSNSQHKCDDDHLHHHHHNHNHHHQHPLHQDQCAQHQQTPKRKFDITKYAPNNASSSSCAAEAATAAVKSLAISQFLKKEVRVQCRRLRAPFRRYRYRR